MSFLLSFALFDKLLLYALSRSTCGLAQSNKNTKLIYYLYWYCFMSLICGLNELCFDFAIYFISTNLARFKEAVAAGTGGDMLDSSAEFSEALTVRPTTTGLQLTVSFYTHFQRSVTS